MIYKIIHKIIFIFFFSLHLSLICQISINNTGNPPHSSSILDLESTDKGLLIPRMTTEQRNSISNPANSLLIFNTSSECFEAYHSSSSSWKQIACLNCMLPSSFIATNASNISPISFTANWNASNGATSYFIDVSINSNFTSLVPGYSNLNVGNVTSYNITGLSCNTTYYYRVRANNNCGSTNNSNVIMVITGACVPTVSCTAGGYTQFFMRDNINIGNFISGSLEQNNDSQIEKYCYNNNSSNCTSYGALYQWAEAVGEPYSSNSALIGGSWQTCDICGGNGRQGICPLGFHVPTDLEWSRYEWCVETTINLTGSTSLTTFQGTNGWRGSSSTAGPGYKMKVTNSHSPSWDGVNSSGFSALPAGYRYNSSNFYDINQRAMYWTATEYTSNMSWYRSLYSNIHLSYRDTFYKTSGFSLRCIQN
ncbi:MAG: hypothetical protein N2449_00455 [Bacteroidales bacterium]|nr:hypothetical protein [Bacteroidales bacterium]